jgi:hypothetical protein
MVAFMTPQERHAHVNHYYKFFAILFCVCFLFTVIAAFLIKKKSNHLDAFKRSVHRKGAYMFVRQFNAGK